MMEEAAFKLDKSQVVPFLLTDWEVPAATLTLKTQRRNTRIRLTFEIGWSKPVTADLGEFEVIIREGSSTGREVFRGSEMCHWNALMQMDCELVAPVAGEHSYWLNVMSDGRRAIINGPIVFHAATVS
ncbi:hypothetical protein [Paenibacillus sp. MMS18-CY102]|uniref:hypothetical protein n=1 Tax=Paenibacillus sp. MMS18-CY102 TaxID=2682849 RepID=UPI00136577A9|nr:hypothetical protein [Paenibacillus sp. MMS18-CY102]MWC29506.1 hypothetical protein [Paenibacillus sp. MMS18-CY102]